MQKPVIKTIIKISFSIFKVYHNYQPTMFLSTENRIRADFIHQNKLYYKKLSEKIFKMQSELKIYRNK